MKTLLPILALFCVGFFTSILQAQPDPASGNPWTFIDEGELRAVEGEREIVPQRYLAARLDAGALQSILKEAPLWFTEEARNKEVVLSLPMPDGTFERFRVEYAPIAGPEFSKMYPMIRAYRGFGIDDPTAFLRFDITQKGFHAAVFRADHQTVFIDPYFQDGIEDYLVYNKKDYLPTDGWECMAEMGEEKIYLGDEDQQRVIETCQIKFFDLAIGCTAEFSNVFGGENDNPADVKATVHTIMTRVNGIFERDLSISMVVEDNRILVYFDPSNDPYTNNNLNLMLTENQEACDEVIGFNNYDIGHVFSTCMGGKTGKVGTVCGSMKAQAVSGRWGILDDFFYVQTVAHEMGHQFGAWHTLNKCSNSSTNYSQTNYYEPGGGSTIMGYSNGCGNGEVVQTYADDYFHAKSIDEITKYLSKSSSQCHNPVITLERPQIFLSSDQYLIPKGTPFFLTAEYDPEDPYTYCWEQFYRSQPDIGVPLNPAGKNGPLFRSYPPKSSPTRYFPSLDALLMNAPTPWEVLPNPTLKRDLRFRLTVRDNHPGGGCTSYDDVVVTVDPNSGPFKVTSPNLQVSWPALSTQTITWNKANTNTGLVNCTHVDILISFDGGLSFTPLATSVPNTGEYLADIPDHQTESARILIKGSGKIFFDISDQNFTISAPVIAGEAGPPEIEWQSTLGGTSCEVLNTIQQTTDGGFILGGYSESNISGDKTENSKGLSDFWAIKLNSDGNISWQKTIGGLDHEEIMSIQQTSDGGYILGGYSYSNISGDKTQNSKGDMDFWIVKLDPTGNISWQKTIGGSSEDLLSSIQQTDDGGFIVGGESSSNISGDKTQNCKGVSDYWIVKLDPTGNISWQKTIGGSSLDHLSSIQQTSDGGYILGGYSYSNISGDKTQNSKGAYDYWIVKLDPTGNISWQKTIGGSANDYLSSIQQTNDGGFILGGYSYSNISGDKTENSKGLSDFWVIKLNFNGNISWQKTIGGGNMEYLFPIQQTTEGGFILGGSSNSNISGDKTNNCKGELDFWAVKLDPVGNISWQKTIGGSEEDVLFSVKHTSDGGYILGGFSYSNISGDKTENSQGCIDYWVVKLSPETVASASISLDFNIVPPTCYGSANGAIEVMSSGLAGPFSYQWSNNATTKIISGLKAGPYTVTVTQTSTGQTAIGTTILEDPEPFVITPDNAFHPCGEETTGFISLPYNSQYSYQWSTGTTSDDISNLSSGFYSYTVTDNNGCTASDVISIGQKHKPIIDGFTVLPIPLAWWVTVNTSNGAKYHNILKTGYQFRMCDPNGNCTDWNNSNNFQILVPLGVYLYTFEVKEYSTGCITSATQQIPPWGYSPLDDPTGLKNSPGHLAVFPNPTTGILQLLSNRTITNTRILDVLGQLVLEIAGEDIREIDLSLFPAGVYTLDIRFAEDAGREIVRVMKE